MEKSSRAKTRKINKFSKKEIDLAQLFRAVVKKLWLVILVTVLAGGLAFAGSKLFIKPTYRSIFTAYVNNNQKEQSNADILASKSLAHTFSELITSRSVLVEAATAVNLDLSYSELWKMVSTSINNETEIITVSVKATDAEVSYMLAMSIAKTAMKVTPEIVEGGSMKIVDMPVRPTGIYSPNYTQLTVIGALVGFVAIVLILCIRQFFNDKVQNEEELSEHYNIPVMGTIPDFDFSDKNANSYYYYYSSPQTDKSAKEKKGAQQQ